GYDAIPGPIYGYGGSAYVDVPAVVSGGYVGGPGWYHGGAGDWRQRAWRNGGANQQAERLQQDQRDAALLRQHALQSQAIVQENRMRSIQQTQEARMRSIQQVQEARMRSIQQVQEARMRSILENRALYQRQWLEAQQKGALGQH